MFAFQSLQRGCRVLAILVLAIAGPATGALATEDFLVQVWNTDEGLPHSTVTSIAQTPDGYLWLGTLLGGVSRFDGQRFVNFHPGNTPELRSFEIHKLLVNAQGTLWIGTVEGALISYRNGRFRFERQDTETPGAWNYSVVSSSTNSVTLSSYYGWLFRGTQVNGTNRWETVQTPDAMMGTSPCADSQGGMWYQKQDGQLGQIEGNQFVTVTNPPGLGGQQINTLVADTEGRLWVGTDLGLAVWDGKTFVNMMPTNGEPELKVQQIAPCRDGSLWVLTDHELRKWRQQQWVARVNNWPENESETSALPQSPIASPARRLLADSRGGLWMLHYGDGLWHVDAAGQVSRVLETQGLPNTLVEAWYEDCEGNMWLGLNGGGLACVRRRTFHNIMCEENNLIAHSICEDPSGTLWFGSGSTATAVLTLTNLAAATHSLTASYGGDTNNAGSLSSARSLTVNPSSSATTLVSSLNPSPPGQNVTFTATVRAVSPGAGTPTNAVQFSTNGVAAALVNLNASAQAAFTTGGLPHGYTVVTAQYVSDGNFLASTSSVTQLVNSPPAANPLVLGAVSGLPATLKIIGGANGPTDADGDPLVVTAVGAPGHGIAGTDGTNATYTAANNFAGTDVFNYTVSDNFGATATNTVTVSVVANGAGLNQLTTGMSGGNLVLTFLGIPWNNYALDQTFSLSPPVWVPVVTNPAPANGLLQFTNTPTATNIFWRIRNVP